MPSTYLLPSRLFAWMSRLSFSGQCVKLFILLNVFLLILYQVIKDKNQSRRIALLWSANHNCCVLYFIIPLLRHFTILGHRNAQNKPCHYRTAPIRVQRTQKSSRNILRQLLFFFNCKITCLSGRLRALRYSTFFAFPTLYEIHTK